MSCKLLEVKAKLLKPYVPKPKLKFPTYRELLDLDRVPTPKEESVDQNQDYLEKLKRKERQQKLQRKLNKLKEEQELKAKKKQQQRAEKKRLRELKKKEQLASSQRQDGNQHNLYNSSKTSSDEDGNFEQAQGSSSLNPTDSEILARAAQTNNNQSGANPNQPESLVRPSHQRRRSQTAKSKGHRECVVSHKHPEEAILYSNRRPVLINNAIYKTQKRVIPVEYITEIRRRREWESTHKNNYQSTQNRKEEKMMKSEIRRRPSSERILLLSKPKAAAESTSANRNRYNGLELYAALDKPQLFAELFQRGKTACTGEQCSPPSRVTTPAVRSRTRVATARESLNQKRDLRKEADEAFLRRMFKGELSQDLFTRELQRAQTYKKLNVQFL